MAERRPAGKATTTRAKKATTHAVQSQVEGVAVGGELVDDGRKVEFMGATFRMASTIGLMPLLKFAHASSKGLDGNDMEGLVALYTMIRDCIDADEWKRFEAHAMDTKAEADDLMGMVQRCIEAISARPTRRPPGSSSGRPEISASLRDPSLTEGMVSPENLGR